MKTAISIPDELMQQVDRLTALRHVARSHIIAEAVRQYLENEVSKNLQMGINRYFEESVEEREVRNRHKRRSIRKVLEKW